MTALGKIRSKGILLIIIIGLGLFAFIAEEAFRSCNGIKGQNSQQIGEVLGEKIYVQDFQKLLEEYQDAMKLTMRTDNLSEDQLNQLKDQVWQQLVSERVMKEDCKKLGLTVTEDELQNVLNDGTNQLLTQTPFVNQQTGRFDVSILKQFIDAYRKAEASNNSQQLDQMRPAYNYWLFVEKNLRTQLLAQKYQSLLANCVLSNNVEAKMAFNEENEEAQIQLASIAYNTIKDADIKVTDEELKAKYEELKPAFRQQQETRDVKMVDVQVKASATDRAQLQKDMAGYQKQLAAAADPTQVVSKSGSMIQYIGLPVSGKAFQQYPDIASKIDSMAVGTTGVVENTKDNTYNIVRILSRTEFPDSVEFRQIQVGGKTLEAARASADSIQKALAAGGDFQAIAKRYGQDSTTTWFTGAMYEQATTMSQDNRAYIEALLNGAVGSTQNVELTQGNVVIQVLNRKSSRRKSVSPTIPTPRLTTVSASLSRRARPAWPTCRSTPRSLATRSRISTTSPPPAIRWATSVVPASATPALRGWQGERPPAGALHDQDPSAGLPSLGRRPGEGDSQARGDPRQEGRDDHGQAQGRQQHRCCPGQGCQGQHGQSDHVCSPCLHPGHGSCCARPLGCRRLCLPGCEEADASGQVQRGAADSNVPPACYAVHGQLHARPRLRRRSG